MALMFKRFGLCLRVDLMKEWLPAVRFISFIRPTRRQRPEVVVARAAPRIGGIDGGVAL
jgi:hypothetical protein